MKHKSLPTLLVSGDTTTKKLAGAISWQVRSQQGNSNCEVQLSAIGVPAIHKAILSLALAGKMLRKSGIELWTKIEQDIVEIENQERTVTRFYVEGRESTRSSSALSRPRS